MKQSKIMNTLWIFLVASLVTGTLWTATLMAREINSEENRSNVQASENQADQIERSRVTQANEALDTPEAIDVDQITQIRVKSIMAQEKIQRAQTRIKHEQIARVEEQVKSQSFLQLRASRQTPTVTSPFRFNRESSRLSRAPTIPLNRTFLIQSDTITINTLVNGADADTITQGDDFTVTIYFSSGAYEADVSFWVDANGNGTWEDTVDVDVGEGDHIMDNDEGDENPSVGVYQFTFFGDDDEGPNRVSNLNVLLVAEDVGGSDAAFLYIQPVATDYSVSGAVTPKKANIIVGAFHKGEKGEAPWMTVTDTSGSYQDFLPDSGTYGIFSFDFLGVTEGMFPDTFYTDVPVDGHLTNYDFDYITPTAWIEGTAEDEYGNPLEGVEVWAHPEDRFGVWTVTDENGYFILGVIEGTWWIGLEQDDLIPEYLVPHDEEIDMTEGDTSTVDFTAYSTDATISGKVLLNGFPTGDIGVGAGSDLGWTETRSSQDGFYTLSVTSAANDEGGYDVWVWDLPPNAIVDEFHKEIMSGSMGVDFHLYTVLGAIEGFVYDVQTGNRLDHAWVSAWNGERWFGTGTHEDGFYHLPLPNGIYEVDAGADGYYPSETLSNVIISDNVIELNFGLEPVTFEGSLSGYVYDADAGSPLEGAEVGVGSDLYWDYTVTDTVGYYYFDLPNDTFWVGAWKDDYTGEDTTIVIYNNDVVHDFYLEPIILDAAIEGVVFDSTTGDPIVGGFVHAKSYAYGAGAMTGAEGYFLLEVPSDTFWLDANAPGYIPEFGIEVITVSGETTSVEIGLKPVQIRPHIHAVTDVPNDQGRQVRVTWWSGNPVEHDGWTKFSIWRLAHGEDHEIWDFIAIVPFHGIGDYAIVAPTLVDSNATTGATEDYWSTFMVTAHTFKPWVFFDSEPNSGYSVDNLEPSIPAGLIVDQGAQAITLRWRSNPEKDLDYYAIYRGTTSGFVAGDPLAYTVDTLFVDEEVTSGVTYHYVVTATDFNGNESDYSQEAVGALLGIDEVKQIPTRFELAQNFPNPFNPVTTIRYALPMRANVILIIYDALGRKVRTVVDNPQDIGYYNVIWDGKDDAGRAVASGIYFSQLTVHRASSTGESAAQSESDFVKTRKMILLR